MPCGQQYRIAWLDCANVLAMFGVVWFHIPSALEAPIRNNEFFVVNFTFFVLAGISYGLVWNKTEKHNRIKFIKGRFRRLAVPTICFFTVFYILWLLVGRNLAGDSEQWYEPLVELLSGSLRTVMAPYWFVFCLFTMQILFTFVPREGIASSISYLILGLTPLLCVYLDIPDFYELSQALLFIPFFAIGTVLFKPDGRLFLTMAGLIVFIIAINITTSNSLCYNWYDILTGSLYVIIVIMISQIVSKFKKTSGPILFLRYGAVILLATQNNIIGICRVFIGRISGATDYLEHSMILKIVVLILVYAITIPIICVVKRYLPWVMGKSKKHA